jgi:hypothetical protein
MKPIKLTPENAALVEAALAKTNGKAEKYAYKRFSEIKAVADIAEDEVSKLGIPSSRRPGAYYEQTSGEETAKSYPNSRRATTVVIARRQSGWVLTELRPAEIYYNGGGKGKLSLTKAQHDYIHDKLSKKYTLIAESTET